MLICSNVATYIYIVLNCSARQNIHVVIIMIIKTLFQEDNIFGTNASLTYGLQIHKTYMLMIITDRTRIIYRCTERVRSPYTEHAASGLPNPTPLDGEVRFIQAQDQQVLPHVVQEW